MFSLYILMMELSMHAQDHQSIINHVRVSWISQPCLLVIVQVAYHA